MKREIGSFVRRLRQDEKGAVIVVVSVMIVALIGLAALAVDVGNLVYSKRMLQATTDLAAEAGASVIFGPNSATAAAIAYSAESTKNNVQSGSAVTMPSGYPKLVAVNGTATGGCPTTIAELVSYPACIQTGLNSTSSGGCTNTGGCNAIVVEQQITVSPILEQVFGMGAVTLTATSLAVGKGGALPPLNIMMIIDNSESMSSTHETGTTCGGISNPTKIQCALSGVQTLLTELWPTQDQVGIMVFPGLANTTSVTNDIGCATPKTTCTSPSTCSIEMTSYNNSPIYQLVSPTNSGGGSTNSYCSVSQGNCGSSTALSTSSPIVSATCQSGMLLGQSTTASCGSCAGEQVQGGEGTYFADAITQAQATLVATNKTGVCATLSCQNVIILLSDGGAGNAGDAEGGTANTSIEALAGSTTLTFASVPTYVVAGSTVADNTNTSAIPKGTTVVSATGTTVTLSALVSNLGTAPTSAATSNTATLTFASGAPPAGLAQGASVADSTIASAIPAGTTVTAVVTGGGRRSTCVSGSTCVTLSANVTVAKGDTIAFGFVGQRDQIAFSSNNQCNDAIAAAHKAANAGTWVYAIAYGSGLGDPQADTVANVSDYTSCSDTETPKVNSCYTMSQIASSPGAIPDPSRFYSDPMAGGTTPSPSQYCVSPANPSATSVPSIFSNIANNLTHTLLVGCGTTAAGGSC
jgi:Flp pilus assembly protein TadG